MNNDKALQHMIAWTIQNIYETNKEAAAVLNNEEMSEADKILKLRGPQGYDYTLLKLMILLHPVLDAAESFYGEQKQFFDWFKERWAEVIDKKYVTGQCGCQGCKAE